MRSSRKTIGIVDYGVGNQASVWRALHKLDYRCRVSDDPKKLDETDILFLPGVGAFPAAMKKLHEHDLVEYLQGEARQGKPFVGLCLGMQLLAERSHEHGLTAGLGLIPGEVVPFPQGGWHIGWNAIERLGDDPMFDPCDGMAMYFNHSFIFDAPEQYRVYAARTEDAFPVGVRRGNLVGMQFHPEKSQEAGRTLLRALIEGLCQ